MKRQDRLRGARAIDQNPDQAAPERTCLSVVQVSESTRSEHALHRHAG
jgi:hypothetical protein